MAADAPVLPAWLSQELCEADMANESRWLAGISLQRAKTALRAAHEGEQQARARFESQQCSYADLRAAVRRTFELEQELAARIEIGCRHRGRRASYGRRIGEGAAELVLRGPMEIDGGNPSLWSYRLLDELYLIDQRCGGIERIAVTIDSPGGSLLGGLSIFEALLEHAARVVVTIEGMAASAAALVALAGDTIRIAPGARVMLHSARLTAREQLTHAEAVKACCSLGSDNRRIREILASRTCLAPAQIDEVMVRDVWFDARHALAAGLAHEITQPDEVPAA
jgi:ATP-dependent protease ClpP protease subunit